MKMQTKDAALAACVSAAQADADRFHGATPAPTWRPRPRRGARLWLIGLLATATGVAGAVMVRQGGQPMVAANGAAATKAHIETGAIAALPTLGLSTPQRDADTVAPAVATPPVAPPRIERVGAEFVIELSAWPRASAAAALAALTGSQLLGAPGALDRAGLLTLHWRGRDPAAAWQAVLGDATSHALRCGARSCQVWVHGALATSSGAVLPAGTSPATADAVAAGAPLGQAAAAPSVAPMQPDPPGLFPSESPSASD